MDSNYSFRPRPIRSSAVPREWREPMEPDVDNAPPMFRGDGTQPLLVTYPTRCPTAQETSTAPSTACDLASFSPRCGVDCCWRTCESSSAMRMARATVWTATVMLCCGEKPTIHPPPHDPATLQSA